MAYRIKPKTFEAWQNLSAALPPPWVITSATGTPGSKLTVQGPLGSVTANATDWLIQTPSLNVAVIDDLTFQKTYQLAT